MASFNVLSIKDWLTFADKLNTIGTTIGETIVQEDLIDPQLVPGLADMITDSVRLGVEGAITSVEANIAKIEGDAKQKMIDMYNDYLTFWNTPVGFWSTIGIAAAGVVLLPYAVEGIGAITTSAAFLTAMESLKGLSVSLFAEIDFMQLELINAVFKLVFPSYNDALRRVSEAFSGFLEFINQPINTFNLLLDNLNNTYLSFSQLTGINSEGVYAKGLYQASEFFRKLDTNVSRYVQTPSLLWEDFRLQVQKPVYDEYGEVVGKYNEQIREAIESTTKVRQDLETFSVNFDNLLQMIPEKMRTGDLGYFVDLVEAAKTDIVNDNKWIEDELVPTVEEIQETLDKNAELIRIEAEKKLPFVDPYADMTDNFDERMSEKGLVNGMVIFKAIAEYLNPEIEE